MPALPPGERKIRALGWLLVILGALLSGGIACIAFGLHNVIVHSGDPGGRAHWTGSPEVTRRAFELFGAVFLFGLVALAEGIFQVRTGRRNVALVALMALAVAAMFYLGYEITTAVVPER